jgi:RNA polymerase sigma-70 factor (ECF subfamily)
VTTSSSATTAPRTRTDDGLGVRFARRDPRAVHEIYVRHGATLFSTAYQMLGDRDMAGEAVQRALLRAWQRADLYDHERPLEPWLHAICRRTAIDTYRSHRRHPEPVADTELQRRAPTVTLAADDDPSVVRDVRAAIERLPPGERQVMTSAYLHGLTHVEVAEKLGVPVGTIKSRTHRAHRRLARQLSHLRDR